VYNKLFSKIVDSSIWLESDATRIVWLTMIAVMDEDGFVVMASIENLARRANVSVARCSTAVAILEGPDPNSADPDHEGRRIERVPGGWVVLNAAKHRLMVARLTQRESNRRRVKRHREGKLDADGNASVMPCNASVMVGNDMKRSVMQSEAEAEVHAEAETHDARAMRQPVQHRGASAPNSLPREHLHHTICGPAFRFCLSEKLYGILAGIYNDEAEAAKVAITQWVAHMEDTVLPPGKSQGDLRWVVSHFNAWLVSIGRVAAAPAAESNTLANRNKAVSQRFLERHGHDA
jgi:hypothetical protein